MATKKEQQSKTPTARPSLPDEEQFASDETLSADMAAESSRQAMLEMAKEWEEGGSTNQAIGAYSDIVKADPDSQEASYAREALLRIAKRFEKGTKKYSARYLYKKLLKA